MGTPADIRSAALGENTISGRVTYIDTALNEETRTGRVRVETANPGERLKIGMFVEVGFQTGTGAAESQDLVIPDEAVQRIGDRSVGFVAKAGELGHFEVRDVQLGDAVEGYRRVLNGLALGDRVVTKGGFALKTQLMKKSFGRGIQPGYDGDHPFETVIDEEVIQIGGVNLEGVNRARLVKRGRRLEYGVGGGLTPSPGWPWFLLSRRKELTLCEVSIVVGPRLPYPHSSVIQDSLRERIYQFGSPKC